MDKIVDHLFVFEGDGKISDFPGNYTVYRNDFLKKQEIEKAKENAKAKLNKKQQEEFIKENIISTQKQQKLTFKEKREFEELDGEIANLEEQKNIIEKLLNSGNLHHDELFQKSTELNQIKALLDEKELRWLELSEIG